MKTVAVLGSGPAGLMAAHAVGLCGRMLSIHSRTEKSLMGGAQYLHHSIPMLTGPNPELILINRLHGSAEDYADKVYGTDPMTRPSKVSAMDVHDGQEIPAWSLNEAYDRMWEWSVGSINEASIDGKWIEEHQNEFELIISSIPRPALCVRPDIHRFTSQSVWISPGPATFIPVNEVHYNGDKSPAWYRASNINGTAGGVEWSTNGPKPPVEGLVRVEKPLRHNCDCWPEIFHVGRYGQWMKGVLTHDAFFEVGRMLTGAEPG